VVLFLAINVWPSDLGCSAGLANNVDALVFDHNDQPIDGLYACGNDMGSIMAGIYSGPGTMLRPAMVFGYLPQCMPFGHGWNRNSRLPAPRRILSDVLRYRQE
jgi:hypothetical protein